MGFFRNAFAAAKRGVTNACTAVKDTISSIPKKFKDFTRKAVRTLKRTAVKINAALPVIRCHLVKTINSILDWIKAHPYLTALIIFSIILAIAFPHILGAVGFTAAGPLAGSLAASLQPAVVAARSLFAILQSAAMGGYGVGILLGSWLGFTAAGMLAIAAWNYFFRQ